MSAPILREENSYERSSTNGLIGTALQLEEQFQQHHTEKRTTQIDKQLDAWMGQIDIQKRLIRLTRLIEVNPWNEQDRTGYDEMRWDKYSVYIYQAQSILKFIYIYI